MAAREERRKLAVRARVSRVQRHLNLQVFAKAAVVPAWVAATGFVLFRLFAHHGVAVVGVGCAIGAVVATWWLARQHAVTEAQAAVIADRQANAGGLLLTRLETSVGEWEFGLNQQLHALALPPLSVRKELALLVLALTFVAAGLLVPISETVRPPTNAAAATRVEELQEKAEALAKEEPADATTTAELERLKEQLADSAFDAKDWEAADALDHRLDTQAAEAAAELARAEKAAEALAASLAKAQGNDSAQREREELERALMDLSDGQASSGQQALEQALGQQGENGEQGRQGKQAENGQQGAQGNQAENGQQGTQGKQAENGQQGANGQQGKQGENGQQGKGGPSPAQLSDLRRALAERREHLSKGFDQRAGQQASKQGKPGQAGQTGQSGQSGKSGEPGNSGQSETTGSVHASRGVEAGAGVARGGETKELVFGGEAEIDPSRLKLDTLPQGNGGEGEQLIGLQAANPATGKGGVSAALGTGPAGSQAAGYNEGSMRPRNRALVQRYFDSK